VFIERNVIFRIKGRGRREERKGGGGVLGFCPLQKKNGKKERKKKMVWCLKPRLGMYRWE